MLKKKAQRTTIVSSLVSWTPLVASLAVLCQLFFNGYLPALEKSDRLDLEEAQVNARLEHLAAHTERLEAEQRMLSDDVYRERVRRTLHDPRQPTLTLRRAWALSYPVNAGGSGKDL